MFAKTTFQGLSLFVGAKMNTSTSFDGATFEGVPPQFFGAELVEGTVWPAYQRLADAKEEGRSERIRSRV
jgi:hypothetical protein